MTLYHSTMKMFRLLLLYGTGAAAFCRAYQRPLLPTAPRVLCRRSARVSSAIDVEPGERGISIGEREQHGARSNESETLLRWKDVLPISVLLVCCLLGSVLTCAYESYDVSCLRPSPSTLRRRAPTFQSSSGALGFMRSATMGMGWGESNRAVEGEELCEKSRTFVARI